MGSIPGRVKSFFLFSTASRPAQRSYQVGIGDSSAKLKRPGREAYHLTASSAEVKNGGAIHPFLHTPSWHGDQLCKAETLPLQQVVHMPTTTLKELILQWYLRKIYNPNLEAGIAQSVLQLATGWTTEGSEFRVPVWSKLCSLLHVVQTGSGVHPTSYPISIGDSFPGGKAAGAWSWPLTSS
jgi:hypothetical protein